jgi:hypothetical protein
LATNPLTLPYISEKVVILNEYQQTERSGFICGGLRREKLRRRKKS